LRVARSPHPRRNATTRRTTAKQQQSNKQTAASGARKGEGTGGSGGSSSRRGAAKPAERRTRRRQNDSTREGEPPTKQRPQRGTGWDPTRTSGGSRTHGMAPRSVPCASTAPGGGRPWSRPDDRQTTNNETDRPKTRDTKRGHERAKERTMSIWGATEQPDLPCWGDPARQTRQQRPPNALHGIYTEANLVARSEFHKLCRAGLMVASPGPHGRAPAIFQKHSRVRESRRNASEMLRKSPGTRSIPGVRPHGPPRSKNDKIVWLKEIQGISADLRRERGVGCR
jgi:hypothetical protein